jgi:hypothetical protein
VHPLDLLRFSTSVYLGYDNSMHGVDVGSVRRIFPFAKSMSIELASLMIPVSLHFHILIAIIPNCMLGIATLEKEEMVLSLSLGAYHTFWPKKSLKKV